MLAGLEGGLGLEVCCHQLLAAALLQLRLVDLEQRGLLRSKCLAQLSCASIPHSLQSCFVLLLKRCHLQHGCARLSGQQMGAG